MGGTPPNAALELLMLRRVTLTVTASVGRPEISFTATLPAKGPEVKLADEVTNLASLASVVVNWYIVAPPEAL